jgi:hypothetical protein
LSGAPVLDPVAGREAHRRRLGIERDARGILALRHPRELLAEQPAQQEQPLVGGAEVLLECAAIRPWLTCAS